MKKFWLFAFVTSVACGGSIKESPEACLSPQLAGIDTQYFREAIDLCQGSTWEICPARGSLEAKYDELRRHAVESCQ